MTYIPNAADTTHPTLAEPDAQDFVGLLLGTSGNGVLSGCAVSASSPVAMSVDVASGLVITNHTKVAVSAVTSLTIGAHSSSPRIDLITVDSSGTVAVVQGTGATTPAIPAIPSNKIALAIVYVSSTATSISSADIQDKRVNLALAEQTIYQPVLNSAILSQESLASSGTNPKLTTYQAKSLTTDATTTTMLAFTLTNNAATIFTARVVAIRTGGSAGNVGDAAGYVVTATFTNPAGTAALVGSVAQTVVQESNSAYNCTFDASGSTARLRITGDTANSISWLAHIDHLEVVS